MMDDYSMYPYIDKVCDLRAGLALVRAQRTQE